MEIAKKLVAKDKDKYGQKPITIAFLGDSVTQGCFEYGYYGAAEYHQSFSSKLQRILQYLCPCAQTNIINSGIGGDYAANGLKRFDRDIAPFSPDLVVVGFALNDCTFGMGAIENYKQALEGIFAKVKGLGAECILLTPNLMNDIVSPYLKEENLIKIAHEFLECPLEEYVRAAKEVAVKNSVTVCDVYAKWKLLRELGVNTTELLANKLNHPTREMHWLPAIMLAETILEK